MRPAVTSGWLRSSVLSLRLWRHKAAALHMGTRNIIANPEQKLWISYSCSWDAVALVLQITAKTSVRQIMGMALAPQRT